MCFAPNKTQAHVVNHQNGIVNKDEERNVL
jgi:enhancing lycopene biosynthesis protein 2